MEFPETAMLIFITAAFYYDCLSLVPKAVSISHLPDLLPSPAWFCLPCQTDLLFPHQAVELQGWASGTHLALPVFTVRLRPAVCAKTQGDIALPSDKNSQVQGASFSFISSLPDRTEPGFICEAMLTLRVGNRGLMPQLQGTHPGTHGPKAGGSSSVGSEKLPGPFLGD